MNSMAMSMAVMRSCSRALLISNRTFAALQSRPNFSSSIYRGLSSAIIVPTFKRFSTQTHCRISIDENASSVLSSEAEDAGPEDSTQGELPKSFDFSSEERIYKWWESEGYFKPSVDQQAPPFVICMPPPNVTGALHMGHAMFVTLQDIMIRFWRMKGRPTLWLPGTDHAGIATQLVVEKMLQLQGIKREDLSRDEFIGKVWEWKMKYGGTILNQLKRLGASCDWSREHFTLDEQSCC